MDTELLVPYGQNSEGKLISAAEATRQTDYYCPACLSPLVLHAGQSVVRHFAHKSNSPCNSETIAHKTAKRLLAQIISEYQNTKTPSILITCDCTYCSDSTSIKLPKNSFTSATEEYRIGNFICDVIAFRGSTPVLGIEVLVTHAVDEKKSSELKIPWIELTATEVLDNPYFWRPTASRLKSITCNECKKHIEKLKTLADQWSQPLHEPARFQNPSKDTYLSAIECCWKCKREILVYWWNEVPFATKAPPEPKPKTIQYRYSKNFGGSYWANTCPSCSAVQGDTSFFFKRTTYLKASL